VLSRMNPSLGKTVARKAMKAAWSAGPPFPIASDLSLLSKAIAAAIDADSPLGAAKALALHGVPVFPVTGQGGVPPMPLLYEFADRQRVYGVLLFALAARDLLAVKRVEAEK
jgi:hypothetical protein